MFLSSVLVFQIQFNSDLQLLSGPKVPRATGFFVLSLNPVDCIPCNHSVL
jgi:hypothetical protein